METTPVILILVLCAVQTIAVNIGSPCTTHTDCTVENSYCAFPYKSCTNGYCTCHDDFYSPLLSNSECKPKVAIGGTCTDNEDCTSLTKNSLCSTGSDRVCSCDTNEQVFTDEDGSYCYEHLANEACTADDHESCLTHYTGEYLNAGLCTTELTCGCDAQYVLEGQVCVTARRGQDCSITGSLNKKRCESNMECHETDDTCQCPADSTWSTAHYACISDDHVIVAQGESCDTTLLKEDPDDLTLDICPATLQCGACPEASNTLICLEPTAGASTAMVSLLALATALGLTLWRLL